MNEIKEKARPYFYNVNSKTLAILIHGFTGSPYDLKELAKFLAAKGISVKAPLLAGHGRIWNDLEKCTCFDWWESVNQEMKWAEGKFDNIFIIGYSFGANLAMDMAARYAEKVNGVVSLGVSVFLRKDFLIRKIAMPIFHSFFKKYRKRYIKGDYLIEYEDSGCYANVPTLSLREFYRFIKYYTKRELKKMKSPILIIHSKDDKITHPRSSQYVYDRIGSEKKELLFLDEINHNPLASRRKDYIFSMIEEFISRHA